MCEDAQVVVFAELHEAGLQELGRNLANLQGVVFQHKPGKRCGGIGQLKLLLVLVWA